MSDRKCWALGLLFFMSLNFSSAQDFYLVYFKNKKGSIGSLDKPEELLTEKSLTRRKKHSIPLDSSDLPVSEVYVNQLRDAGWEVFSTSRWLNAALLNVPPGVVPEIELNFVSRVRPVLRFPQQRQEKARESHFGSKREENFDYGNAKTQIELMGGELLHNKGFKGQGMTIAVLDGGFSNVANMLAFKHLWDEGRVLDTYDFYGRAKEVSNISVTHGTSVLSLMAANLPGQLMGMAPDANYLLYRTEVVAFEYPVEEVFWVMGAERADSMGADLINSSLGYTEFDNPEFNYSYADLNGKTSIVSFGAKMAARKGILVCNSAGNYGARAWRYINTPADTDSILACGSVNSTGQKAASSSFGPTADGRTKPDVAAMGQNAFYALTGGGVSTASGTSFASPLVCGFVACVWQQYPEMTAQELIDAIKKSGNNAKNPNNELGWGIPRYQFLLGKTGKLSRALKIYPNPLTSGADLFAKIEPSNDFEAEFSVFDISGKLCSKLKLIPTDTEHDFRLSPVLNLNPGMYILKAPSLGVKRLVVL
ncbi:MAG: S8 family serine peptidase [Cytophagales bacterium]